MDLTLDILESWQTLPPLELYKQFQDWNFLPQFTKCSTEQRKAHSMLVDLRNEDDSDTIHAASDLCVWQCYDIVLTCTECDTNSETYRLHQKCVNDHVILKMNNEYRCFGKIRCENGRYSIRYGTIFARDLSTPILNIIYFVFYWAQNTNIIDMPNLCDITCNKTLLDWSWFLREMIFDNIIENSSQPIGGENTYVELIESKFGERKYNRDKYNKMCRAVGVIDLKSRECIIWTVDNDAPEELCKFIKEKIRPNTEIHTDSWNRIYGDPYIEANYKIHKKDFTQIPYFQKFANAKKHSFEPGLKKHFYAGYLAMYLFYTSHTMQKKDPVNGAMTMTSIRRENFCEPILVEEKRFDEEDPDFEF